jgi:hypothetical protein
MNDTSEKVVEAVFRIWVTRRPRRQNGETDSMPFGGLAGILRRPDRVTPDRTGTITIGGVVYYPVSRTNLVLNKTSHLKDANLRRMKAIFNEHYIHIRHILVEDPTIENFILSCDNGEQFLQVVNRLVSDEYLLEVISIGVLAGNQAPIDYGQVYAYDDDACFYTSFYDYIKNDEIPLEYRKSVRSLMAQYRSEYIQKHYKKRSCWLNLILDTYKEAIEKNNFRNSRIKQSLTHESLHNIIAPDKQYHSDGNNGYCFEEVKRFFVLAGLKLYVFDSHFTLRCYYEPATLNKNIAPRAMFILLHNKHIYKLDKNIKELEIRVLDKKTKMNEFVSVPSSQYRIVECEEESRTPILINTYQELLDIINNKSIEGTVQVIYNNDSCLDLYQGLWRSGYEPSVWAESNCKITLDKLILHINQKRICVNILNEDGIIINKTFVSQDSLNHYMDTRSMAYNHLVSKNHISSYSENTKMMLDSYPKPPLVCDFEGHSFGEEVGMLDFNKYYTSILSGMEQFPSVNSFDDFMNYDGSKLDKYTIYFVEKLNDDGCYPLMKYSLCYGMNLVDVQNIKLLAMLRPSKLTKSNSADVINRIWANEKLDVKMKKDIPNHIVGLWDKKKTEIINVPLRRITERPLDDEWTTAETSSTFHMANHWMCQTRN